MTSPDELPFLLDTCTLLWLAKSPDLLPEKLVKQLANAESEIYFSAASVWELGIKRGFGFTLSGPLEEFVSSLEKTYALNMLAIEAVACEQLWKLPDIHRDPFDRLLVAQSIVHGMQLVTPDKQIARYPVRVSWD